MRSLILVTAAATLAVTACSSSKKSTEASTTPTSSSPSPSSSLLSKADTITQADAICATTKTKSDAIPSPKSETDYAGLKTAITQSITLHDEFFTAISAVVDKSADASELHAKWLDVEKADFDAFKPIAEKFIAAVDAKNQTEIQAQSAALDKAPDHTTEYASFLKTYGFTSCYDLENNG